MNVAITNAHIVPIAGDPFDGSIVVTDGRVAALGPKARIPRSHDVLDAERRWVLPGFVDAHVHLGVSEEGEGGAGEDTNEMTDPVMAGARAITINPATVMGVADRIGSLEVGKDADIVLWSGDPLDVRNRVLVTWVSGEEVYHYDEASRMPGWAARY